VEDHLGRIRYTLFYLACGLVAGFAQIIMSPDHFSSDIPIGGASGAIAGCLGGFLLFLAKTKIEFKWFIFLWIRLWHGNFRLPAWVFITFWFLEDFTMMILAARAQHEGGGVAFAAHVGGLLFGLCAVALAKLGMKDESEDEEDSQVPSAVIRTVRVHARPTPATIVLEAPTIYLFMGGAQAGPFKRSQVLQMFAAGTISADCLYWQEGMDDWRTAEALRETGRL
jgi:hypothetical protein